jgi:hypothetical protein
MAGMQITQERLPAALRAISRVSVGTCSIGTRVIARKAGSYSLLQGVA